MDVPGPDAPRDASGEASTVAAQGCAQRSFGALRTGQVLGEWQALELRIARGFAECRGLSNEQLEDVYQETAVALYGRPYSSEEHLRNALHTGIKQRALRLHRDERRRAHILARSAPGLHRMAEARAGQTGPEPALLAREDRLIANEFLTELTEQERRVFSWLVEGLQYRAIATALDIPVNQARNAARVRSQAPALRAPLQHWPVVRVSGANDPGAAGRPEHKRGTGRARVRAS